MSLFFHNQSKFSSILSTLILLGMLPVLLFAMYQAARLITKATGTPANITVMSDVSFEPIQSDFYHAFSQGGEESADMLAPVVNEIRALKPRLIRIDHIYDHFDVVGGGSGNLSFNWSKLDSAVDTILATGAKPLLVLSFMPSVIAKDGNIINPPNNWGDWEEVVKQTVEHYSGKNGKNLKGVYYEVWNEPDLGQFGSWKAGNYTELYCKSASGATRAQNVHPFLIGGPSTTGLYKTWILALARSGCRINFFSWHTYNADPGKYSKDQQDILEWLNDYPKASFLPKLITEFGFNGSKDARYGSSYGTAFTAAVVRQLIIGGPAYAFAFQPKDGPGQENGQGWGFITHETNGKKLKPRYFVFNFLDQMKGNRLKVTGEGTWVTGYATKSGTTIRLMLVNFQPEGIGKAEHVPVTFINLTPGIYTCKKNFLSGGGARVGSCELGSSDTTTITGTELKKTIPILPNEVAIIELIPS